MSMSDTARNKIKNRPEMAQFEKEAFLFNYSIQSTKKPTIFSFLLIHERYDNVADRDCH